MLAGLLLAAGCAQAALAMPTVPGGGTRIYTGEVLDSQGVPIFRYTRSSTGRWSVHRSFDANTHGLVVTQAARHDRAYVLQQYVEDHVQLGLRSVVSSPDPDHLAYTTQQGRRIRHRTERIDAPAVTGPTLFGFVVTHWDRLARGEAIEVRFIVAERRRSYRFILRMPEPATVEMRPRSRILQRSIAPICMLFDARTRTILAYEGRIPPRKDGRPVDARVEYRHEADFR